MGLGEVILKPCSAMVSSWKDLLHLLGDSQPWQGSYLVQAYDCRRKERPRLLT